MWYWSIWVTESRLIAGVDEAGRGPLAGPVAVAAVILDPALDWADMDDSKALTSARREALAERVVSDAIAWHVVFVNVDEIDRINIFQATMQGMRRAVEALRPVPAEVLVDGNKTPPVALPCRAIVGGDALEPAIGAASILAKTRRDHYMIELDERFPGYGFADHKGYPTPVHLESLARLGPCPEHRRSFAPVRGALQGDLFATP